MALTKYIALLRAVNLGGRQLVAMADLRRTLADLGCANPRSVLQSGNLLFDAARQPTGELESTLEREVEARLGLSTAFFVRRLPEWRAIIERNPFASEASGDPAHLVVLLAKRAPAPTGLAALRGAISGRERVELDGRHLYAVYPDGIGRSKLTVGLIERTLETRVTGRNWNTVLKIAGA